MLQILEARDYNLVLAMIAAETDLAFGVMVNARLPQQHQTGALFSSAPLPVMTAAAEEGVWRFRPLHALIYTRRLKRLR